MRATSSYVLSFAQCSASGSARPLLHGGMESADFNTGCHTDEEPRWRVRRGRPHPAGSAAEVPSHGRAPRQVRRRSFSAFLRKEPSIDTSGTCPHVQETTMERSEEVRPVVRILSLPPHFPILAESRSGERCTHCQ